MTPSIPRAVNDEAELRFRFVTESNPFAWSIRVRTDCLYSHVDIEDGDGWFIGARFRGGVARRSPNYLAPTNALSVAVPIGDEAATAFYGFATDQIGKPYDKSAITRLALGTAAKLLPLRDWRDETNWYCFELAMGALADAGIITPPPCLPVTVVDGDALMFALAAIRAPTKWISTP